MIFNGNKLPLETIKVFVLAEMIRKQYPQIWNLGGNIRGNESYETLKRIMKRNRKFLETERNFIEKVWLPWKARHHNHTRIKGFVASLKWLAVPSVGWNKMRQVLEQEMKKIDNRRNA